MNVLPETRFRGDGANRDAEDSSRPVPGIGTLKIDFGVVAVARDIRIGRQEVGVLFRKVAPLLRTAVGPSGAVA